MSSKSGPAVEIFDRVDDAAAQVGIGKGLAQPMEILDGPLPAHGCRKATLVAELFLGEDLTGFGPNGDPRIELAWIAGREAAVRSDFDAGEERLGIGRLQEQSTILVTHLAAVRQKYSRGGPVPPWTAAVGCRGSKERTSAPLSPRLPHSPPLQQ